MDSGTGTLTLKSETPAAGGPSASAISPNRKTLYVALRNSNEIASYGIDPDTGGLTQISKVSLGATPTFLSPDRNGRFLLSSYYQGAHVAVHPIGDDGSVSDPPIEWLETATAAHAIQTDRSNKFAFRTAYPQHASKGGAERISWSTPPLLPSEPGCRLLFR